jgi:Beta protein
MFNHTHYVPILKGKEGEYRALKQLCLTHRPCLTPLVDLPPVRWNFRKEEPEKEIEAHLSKVPEKLRKSWGTSSRLFVDLYMLQPNTTRDGRSPLALFCDLARGKGFQLTGLKVVPVTGIGRPTNYQEAVRDAVARDGRGLCLRLQAGDFDDQENLEEKMTELLALFEAERSDIDVIIDLKSVLPSQVSTITRAVRSMLVDLPFVDEWRTLTLAASAFPENLSEYGPDSLGVRPRAEWAIWQGLHKEKKKLPRMPTFADYGICHPDFPEDIDPQTLQMAPNIRYTTVNDWLILKGRSVKTHSFAQFNDLCKTLVDRREFCGSDFSWGDRWFSNYAAGTPQSGNATTWRAIGTSHHLEFVTKQIASLSWT